MKMTKFSFRFIVIFAAASLLSGCVYWRLYQTKLQLNNFDQFFTIEVSDKFTWHFKEPLLFSEDFLYLSKLQASDTFFVDQGKLWRYRFIKVDEQNKPVAPEVEFFFDLNFNHTDRLTDWTLSPLFLKIAPPEFLEVSLRSVGGAEINREKNQIKADADSVAKITAEFPKKAEVLAHLGNPLQVKRQDKLQIWIYHFTLQTPWVEAGYEDRVATQIRLMFNENSDELVKMAAQIVGVKIAIDYRKYIAKKQFAGHEETFTTPENKTTSG
jgi:hypothetical protein